MFGIGSTELLVILVVALVVIGPSKLPEMAKTLGKAMGEFRRMSSDVKRTIEMEADREQKKPAPVAKKTAEKDKAPAAEGSEAGPDTVCGDRGETVAAASAPEKQPGSADEEKA